MLLQFGKAIRILSRLRSRHLPFCLVVPLLIVVVTWPAASTVFDMHTERWPADSGDLMMKYWDAWYGKRILAGQASLYHTDLLFYPSGLSLVFHNFSLPHMAVFGGLSAFLPAVNAYELTYLLTLFSNALAAYVFLLCAVRDKWVATAGSAVFTLNPYIINHSMHPETIILATIPLALYAYRRSVNMGSMVWLLLSGILVGITAYVGLYVLVCLGITLGVYALMICGKNWRRPRYWMNFAALGLVAGAVSSARVYPMISSDEGLAEALAKSSITYGEDDANLLINRRHPLVAATSFAASLEPRVTGDGYIGYALMFLIALGCVRGRRREWIPWLGIALFFVVLRMGHLLQFNGQVFSDIVLPKLLLDDVFPWLFKGFWNPTFLHIGVLLPLAMLVALAMRELTRDYPRRAKVLAVLAITLVLVFEYYQPPALVASSDTKHRRWISWLQDEGAPDEIRLIHLPMGRHFSKVYGFYQTLNGFPYVEGLAARTPADAYSYIEANKLLSSWFEFATWRCESRSRDDFLAALDELVSDGFTHVILHRDLLLHRSLADNFVNILPAYRDERLAIYRIESLRLLCDLDNLSVSDSLSSIPAIGAPSATGLSLAPTLRILPDIADGDSQRAATSLLIKDRQVLALNIRDVIRGANSVPRQSSIHPFGALAADHDYLILAYDAATTAPDIIADHIKWLSMHLRECDQVVETEEAISRTFALVSIYCNIAFAEEPLEIRYDNGIQLQNLAFRLKEDTLNLALLWKSLPDETHSVSFQVFDANETRLLGQDFTFGRDALSQYQVDLSALEPGNYIVKLIVYNYETGVSLPGVELRRQERFDRALEVATITVD